MPAFAQRASSNAGFASRARQVQHPKLQRRGRTSVAAQAAQAKAASAPTTAPAAAPSISPARVAVLGASGYTGEEVVRLSAGHPGLDLVALTGDSQAGKPYSEVYPHLASASRGASGTSEGLVLTKIDDVDWSNVDAAFCCLPHATTQETLSRLPRSVKIVDLSADFRLRDVDVYAEWYGGPHRAPELQKEAVYGLTELARESVRGARLVANPGCYPTSVQLPLVPLLESKLIGHRDIVIDAKSGVSGAGRSAKLNLLYTEIAEGINAYGVGSHRHMPEIEQGLSDAVGGGASVEVSFTPHLMPMARGMLSTMYVSLEGGATADDLRDALSAKYEGERFVHVLAAGQTPHTRHVRGSNHCLISVFKDRRESRAIVLCAIDNLMKGASGQAVQNLNLMMGWDEGTGLGAAAMFP